MRSNEKYCAIEEFALNEFRKNLPTNISAVQLFEYFLENTYQKFTNMEIKYDLFASWPKIIWLIAKKNNATVELNLLIYKAYLQYLSDDNYLNSFQMDKLIFLWTYCFHQGIFYF